jgi:hypothetical protein
MGLVHVLAGRLDDVRPWVEAGLEASEAMGSRPGITIGRSLLAEVTLRAGGTAEEARRWLEDLHDPGGMAGAILLRARTVLGEPGASAALGSAVEALRAPGLARDLLS